MGLAGDTCPLQAPLREDEAHGTGCTDSRTKKTWPRADTRLSPIVIQQAWQPFCVFTTFSDNSSYLYIISEGHLISVVKVERFGIQHTLTHKQTRAFTEPHHTRTLKHKCALAYALTHTCTWVTANEFPSRIKTLVLFFIHSSEFGLRELIN